MLDEKELYLSIWDLINKNTTFTKNGFIKHMSTKLPAELVKFIMAIINKETK